MYISEQDLNIYFLEKNDMMLPCPALPAGFFALAVEESFEEDGAAFFGGGASSSEKDSQPGSLTVTLKS